MILLNGGYNPFVPHGKGGLGYRPMRQMIGGRVPQRYRPFRAIFGRGGGDEEDKGLGGGGGEVVSHQLYKDDIEELTKMFGDQTLTNYDDTTQELVDPQELRLADRIERDLGINEHLESIPTKNKDERDVLKESKKHDKSIVNKLGSTDKSVSRRTKNIIDACSSGINDILLFKSNYIMSTLTNDYLDTYMDIWLNALNKLNATEKYFIENNELILEKITPESKSKNKKDDLYIQLANLRNTYSKVDKSEWNEFKSNNDNMSLLTKYNNLDLGIIQAEIEMIENNDYTIPVVLSESSLQIKLQEMYNDYIKLSSSIKKIVKPPQMCDAFEEQFKLEGDKRTNFTLRFINQMTGLSISDIKSYSIIHTETSYIDKKFGNEIISFNADRNFPLDILVAIKLNNGSYKKYGIELKYYNNIEYFFSSEGKKGKPKISGDNTTFVNLCKHQISQYNNFKKNIITSLSKCTDRINDLRSNKKKKKEEIQEIKEIQDRINVYNEMLSNDEIFNNEFNRNIYGYYIPMKFSKLGYRFQTPTESDESYNDPSFYTHMSQRFSKNQKVLNFNSNGIIEKTTTSKGVDYKLESVKILNGMELLLCVSFSDAIIGNNHSKYIRDNISTHPTINKDPFLLNFPVKSNYSYETDSVGLKLENWKLIT